MSYCGQLRSAVIIVRSSTSYVSHYNVMNSLFTFLSINQFINFLCSFSTRTLIEMANSRRPFWYVLHERGSTSWWAKARTPLPYTPTQIHKHWIASLVLISCRLTIITSMYQLFITCTPIRHGRVVCLENDRKCSKCCRSQAVVSIVAMQLVRLGRSPGCWIGFKIFFFFYCPNCSSFLFLILGFY